MEVILLGLMSNLVEGSKRKAINLEINSETLPRFYLLVL